MGGVFEKALTFLVEGDLRNAISARKSPTDKFWPYVIRHKEVTTIMFLQRQRRSVPSAQASVVQLNFHLEGDLQDSRNTPRSIIDGIMHRQAQ
jgi:hypothetical protein